MIHNKLTLGMRLQISLQLAFSGNREVCFDEVWGAW
jgi:hypothetical protein